MCFSRLIHFCGPCKALTFVSFQSVAYYYYELPLFMGMGAIGKVYLVFLNFYKYAQFFISCSGVVHCIIRDPKTLNRNKNHCLILYQFRINSSVALICTQSCQSLWSIFSFLLFLRVAYCKSIISPAPIFLRLMTVPLLYLTCAIAPVYSFH